MLIIVVEIIKQRTSLKLTILTRMIESKSQQLRRPQEKLEQKNVQDVLPCSHLLLKNVFIVTTPLLQRVC
jgi:hypothetical protein